MELRHLRYFTAVAEALSYRRAAQAIRVAQPALSKQIKDLEAEIGVQLLDRNTGGVVLTDAGTAFLEEAKDILERAEMAAKAARDAAAGQSGRLVIGSLGAVSANFLPATLAAFRKLHPRVELTLHELPSPDQVQALQSGTLQVAFTTNQTLPRSPTLESVEVLAARLVVALGRGHRLARQRVVALADLAEETFLCVGGTERHQQHGRLIESVLGARGIRHRPVKRVNGYESLVALVSGGHGVSLLLPFRPSHRPEHLVFREVKEQGDDLLVHIFAVWLKRSRSQLARNFIDVLRQQSARH